MTKYIDKGVIICQKTFPISKKYSLMDNYTLASNLYSEVLMEAIDLIEEKSILDFPLIPEDAPYCNHPSSEDVKRFRDKGFKMI
ncbi:hypothetical protein ACFLRM_04545 [Acidobacteriota bacterium]